MLQMFQAISMKNIVFQCKLKILRDLRDILNKLLLKAEKFGAQ